MTRIAALMALLLQTLRPAAAVAPLAAHDDAGTAGTASMTGVVVRAGTGEPIAGAQVVAAPDGRDGGWLLSRLSDTAPPSFLPQATTDGQGRFLIADLKAGAYLVVAQRSGFARPPYGAGSPDRPGVRITVAPKQAVQNVVVQLVPGGVISGRVANENGEPVAGMTVLIQRSGYGADGRKTLTSVAESRTNNNGVYRAYWITPGRYYALAEPLRSDPAAIAEAGYLPTYYPGVSDESAAAAIDVAPGGEIGAIDFTVTRQRVFRVRGQLPPSETPLHADLIWLVSKNHVPDGGHREGEISNGRFEIGNVPPGSYWVRASFCDVPLFDGEVDVIDADVENVALSSHRGFTVSGRIRREGIPLPSRQDARLRVTLEPRSPLDESLNDRRPATIEPDGSLHFSDVLPGDYRLRADPMPQDTFIKSARFGGVDVLNGSAIIGPTASLDVVLSTRGGQIEGTIVDQRGRPMANVTAVLLPSSAANRTPGRVLTVASDQEGRFVLQPVPPGDYKLFAWADLQPYGFYDLDFVRRYESRGTTVRIAENSRQHLRLTVLD